MRKSPWLALAGVLVAVALVSALAVSQTDPVQTVPEQDPGRWSTVAVGNIVGLRLDGARKIVITAEVPAGAPTCARNLRIENLQESSTLGTVWANVVFDATVARSCPDRAQAEVVLRLAEPVGDRPIMLNSSQRTWTYDGNSFRPKY